MKKRKVISALLAFIFVFTFSACTEVPQETYSPEDILKEWCEIPYDSYSNGITSYYKNLSYLTDNISGFFDNEEYYQGLNDLQKDYYNELRLLLSVMKTELSSLPEYDFLESGESDRDRAEGELLVSSLYGYKLKTNSQIRFGCDDQSLGGSYRYEGIISPEKNYLEVNISDVFSDNTKCSTTLEAVVTDERNCAVRYSKSTEKDGKVITKIAFVTVKDNSAEIAYYEGDEKPSQLVKIDSLINYNINAITFGIGTVISFLYEIK